MSETQQEVSERCKCAWYHQSQGSKAVTDSSLIILYLTPPLPHVSKSFQHQLQNASHHLSEYGPNHHQFLPGLLQRPLICFYSSLPTIPLSTLLLETAH